MRQTELIMGMPVTVEILANHNPSQAMGDVFSFFRAVDQRFSTYKPTSEISQINQGNLKLAAASPAMQQVFQLAAETKELTSGYFDIGPIGQCDPSGLVKGWAINQAAEQLRQRGYQNFYLDVGGDIQADGVNPQGQPWRVGLRHPFDSTQIMKVIAVTNRGVATSGTYERGEHIYNPRANRRPANQLVSLTVIGPNIFEADRLATAAFAMGPTGIEWLEGQPDVEAYLVDHQGQATMTSQFERFTIP